MKLVSRSALLFSLAVAAAVPLAGVAGPGLLSGAASAQALSPAVGRPLQQASAAARAGNIAAAQNFVNQARQAATTSAERTTVARMAAFVHTRAGQYGQAAAELERIGAPASQLAPLFYQARQYDKAIAAARRSGQTTIIAQSYLMMGRPGDAARIYEQMLARSPNNPTLLQNLAGAQFKMGDRQAYLATIQRLIRVDPTPARWRALLVDMKGAPMPRDAKLGLFHLMRETGNLTTAADVQEFAKIAIVAGQPGVAADAVRVAIEAGVMPAGEAMTNRLLDASAKRQTAAMAQAAAQARAPATALAAGHAFMGAGLYPQAIAAYTTAQRGPRAAEAALFRGIAQQRGGQTAAARATFGAVPAGPFADVAGLWDLYASTRG